MRTNQFFFGVCVSVALCAPFGCGKSGDDEDAAATGGNAGATTGGRAGSSGAMNRGGSAGRNGQGTSGSGPTGCEGLSPKTGEPCNDRGIVCPSALGSCVCERQGWQCFEIGGGDGGSGNMSQGGAGPDSGGAPPDLGGAGGAEQGGQGGQAEAGQGGAPELDGGAAGLGGAP